MADLQTIGKAPKTKVLLVTIAPPENNHGCRIVAHRHLVERDPFELHIVTNDDNFKTDKQHTILNLPYFINRVRKSRFAPLAGRWLTDFENFIWPLNQNRQIENVIQKFQPDIILVLADNSLSKIAYRAAKRHKLPLAGLFLDWVPVMKFHFGHSWTRQLLTRWFRNLYRECDLAICTSDGMLETLGHHCNSHVIYPMPGRHVIPEKTFPPSRGKFRLVYVGSVQNFYGRMICALIDKFRDNGDLEFIVVGPNADWPVDALARARDEGIYLGFKPPHEASSVLAGADALLVVMSFEKENELFMRTSFTTKFLDYAAYGKPIVLWGPPYCTPFKVATKSGGAWIVDNIDPAAVVHACRRIRDDSALRMKLSTEAANLHRTVFNPDRLQDIFVTEMEKLATKP